MASEPQDQQSGGEKSGEAFKLTSRMQEIRDFKSGCLHRRLINACKALITRGIPFALIIIDIDHFRSYNDSQGSFEGDILLNKAFRPETYL